MLFGPYRWGRYGSADVFTFAVPQLPVLYGDTLDCQWIDLFELGNSTVGHMRAGW